MLMERAKVKKSQRDILFRQNELREMMMDRMKEMQRIKCKINLS